MKHVFVTAVLVAVSALLWSARGAQAEHKPLPTGAFEVTHTLTLDGSPEEVFDAITGDISGWWDHSLSGKPAEFYIEAEPGGGFWEIFDELGNGVRHAVVTASDRGKLLRFEGPLGLAGNAISMVHTYEFAPREGGKTELKVTVRAHGQVEEGWPAVVDGVWHHFLVEQFVPYYNAQRKK